MGKIRGVNLGNWLVLEYWMDKGVFRGVEHEHLDETNFCLELGDKKAQRLKEHRDTFITYDDFIAIKKMGLNTVRIPIPHWLFGDYEPYVGCVEYLDKGMEWAEKAGLKVLIDLHTVPGSQNGFDNGGIIGKVEWHTKKEYIDRTVDVIERVAERYKDHKALYGIQLLNEPIPVIPKEVLRDYYTRAYRACRKYVGEEIAIVIHDQFQAREWKDFMQTNEFKNVMLDTHIYHCFTEEDNKMTPSELIETVMTKRMAQIKEMSEYFPIIVGEWSLGIHPEYTFKELNEAQIDALIRAYASVQTLVYEGVEGWFFWSYKLNNDEMHSWDYRKCVDHHWMPKVIQ